MSARLVRNGQELWLDGAPYTAVLAALHARLRPALYFEIGVLHGDTLCLAQGRALGVDPIPQVAPERLAGRSIQIVTATSDAFFARGDLATLLGGAIDLAFLDGLHAFDALLRDFINTERHMATDGMVVLHDCLPRNAEMTGASGRPGRAGPYRNFWTGDVWKLIPILRRWRPDLTVRCLDAEPTGLAVITGLDPASRVLADAYDEIVAEWATVEVTDWGLARLLQTAQAESAAAWLAAMAPFRDPRPAWKRLAKRAMAGV
jgi:hypothetical protein